MSYPAIPLVELEESGERLQGCFPDMTNAEYHSSQALSASGISRILRSPAHYKVPFGDPTPAMNLGTAVHLLCLEGRDDLVPLAPTVNKRTKAGKAELEEWESSLPSGAIILSPQDRERAFAMHKSVVGLKDIDLSGVTETSFFNNRGDGLYRRARPDLYSKERSIILDLKTSADASESGFKRSVGNFHYYNQAAFYIDTLEACGEPTCDFVFLVVESTEPFGVALYSLDDATLEQGRRENAKACEAWLACTKSGEWPGYSQGIGRIVLPGYLRDSLFDA